MYFLLMSGLLWAVGPCPITPQGYVLLTHPTEKNVLSQAEKGWVMGAFLIPLINTG